VARVEQVRRSDGEPGRDRPLGSPPEPPGATTQRLAAQSQGPSPSSGRSGSPPRPPLTLRARKEVEPRSRMLGRTIVKIDPRTVFVVSLLFYLSFLVVVLVAGIVLWIVASIAGGINSINHFIEQLFGYKSFNLIGFRVILVTILGGLILSILGTLVNVLIATVFNLVSDVVGGVRIAVVDDESEHQPLV
jgi:hypothetical protein